MTVFKFSIIQIGVWRPLKSESHWSLLKWRLGASSDSLSQNLWSMGLESAILTSSLGGFLITLKWRATVWLPAFLLAHLSLFSRSYAHFYQLSHSNILSLSKLSFIVKLQGLPIIQRIKSWSLSNQGPTQYGQQLLCDSPLFQNKDTWTLGLRHLTPIWILSLSYSPMRNRSNSLIPSQFDAKKEKKNTQKTNQQPNK